MSPLAAAGASAPAGTFGRRGLMQAALGLPILGVAAPAVAAQGLDPALPATPEESLALYARIVGNSAGGRTFLQYDCDVWQYGDHIVARPMYQVRGIARTEWAVLPGGGGFQSTGFDHGLVCDIATGRAIDSYANPLTGATNTPLHYRSGPFTRVMKPVDEKGQPFHVPWQSAGGAIWFTETLSGKRPNRLQRATWGDASTGAETYLATRSTYVAEAELLADPARTAVPATHLWTYSAPYEPWMMMGEAPGFQIWQWTGRKITRADALDPYLVGEITRRMPSFFTGDRPWETYVNGAIQYMTERKPR